jgi:hypothetical protein
MSTDSISVLAAVGYREHESELCLSKFSNGQTSLDGLLRNKCEGSWTRLDWTVPNGGVPSITNKTW